MPTNDDNPWDVDENMRIWDELQKTDPEFTKEFKAGGFKGTSVNVTYNTRRITEIFGPCGEAWGFRIKGERIDQFNAGIPNEPIVYVHTCTVQMWFRRKGEPEERIIEAFGTTKMAYDSAKSGYIVDAEAPKKSLTDAMSKLMLMLGASADVWFGWYDDRAYVNEMREEFAAREDEREDERENDRREDRREDRRDDDRGNGREAVDRLRTGAYRDDRHEGGMYDDGAGGSTAPAQRGSPVRRSVDPDTDAGPAEPDDDRRPQQRQNGGVIRLIDPSGVNPASQIAFDRAEGIIERWCADPKVTSTMIRAMINCNKEELLKVPGLVAIMDEHDRKKRPATAAQ